MSETLCPICKSKETSLFIKGLPDINFKTTSEKFDLYSCKSCDAKFQFPFIKEDEIGKYYPNSNYHPFLLRKNIISPKLKYNPASIYLRKLLSTHSTTDKFSLIDIGCGGGTFLMSVKHFFPNANIIGVDVSETAIENLKKSDIDGICGSLYDFETNKKFDYIVSSQVLEHLNHPYLFTKKLQELSLASTIIMIDVPATDSYSAKKHKENWVHWDLPRHSILYSFKTMEKLMSNFNTLELLHAGSITAILSSYKIKKKKDIFFQSAFDKLLLKIISPIAKLLNLNFLFSDKLVWIGKLK